MSDLEEVWDVEVERLNDWLYSLRTPIVAAFAICQSNDFVLVDTGVVGHEHAYLHALAGVAGLAPADVRLSEIFITHGHPDHSGSAAALAELTGARVRGPALDADVIEGRKEHEDPKLLDWEIPLFETHGTTAPAPAVKLDALVEDGDELGWERAARIVAVPGHTVGSVVVYMPDERVVIAGDALASHEGQLILGVFNVDPEQAQESVRRLAELDIELACFGHGDAITSDAQAQLAALAGSF